MKIRTIIGLIVFMACVQIVSTRVAAQDAYTQSNPDVPVAFAPYPEYDFAPVLEGTEVTHPFIIKNTGGKELSIERVKTSCGCTTAAYTKHIHPGSEGKIVIKGNTRGYEGRKFSQLVTVYTNDPKNSRLTLRMSGQVNRFAKIEPKNISLSGPAEENIRASADIIPDPKYPFNIVESSAKDGKHICFKVEKKEDKYLVTVENLLKTKGRYFDSIILKTDNPLKPEISIRVYGNISIKKEQK